MLGIGILLAGISAVSRALDNSVVRNLKDKCNSISIAFVKAIIASIIFTTILSFQGIHIIDNDFYKIAIAVAILSAIATILMIKAIQISGLYTTTMLGFTPIFAILIGIITINEMPSILGIVGVFSVVLGSYLLNISEIKKGILEPFKHLFEDRGYKLMFANAILLSWIAVLFKQGINSSNQNTFLVAVYILQVVIFGIIIMSISNFSKNLIKSTNGYYKLLLLSGILFSISEITMVYSYNFLLVGYAVAIRRMSILLSVIIGFVVFKEKGFREKIIGTIILIVGLVIISVFG